MGKRLILFLIWLSLAVPSVGAAEKGRIAFQTNRDGNFEIYVMDPDGSHPVNLTRNAAEDKWPAWSPDGRQIAFVSNRDGNYEIYVMDPDGRQVARLTHHPALDTWPCWSPDGQKIAFTSHRDGNYEVYVMDADGSNPINLTNHPAFDGQPAWGKDGEIVFVTHRDGNDEVYRMDTDGSNPINLTHHPATDLQPCAGSDSRGTAFVTNRDGQFEIYHWPDQMEEKEAPRPAEPLTVNPADESFPCWLSADPHGEGGLLFTTHRDRNNEIYFMKLPGGKPVNLTRHRASDEAPSWPSNLPFPAFTQDTGEGINSEPETEPVESEPTETLPGRKNIPPPPMTLLGGQAVRDYLERIIEWPGEAPLADIQMEEIGWSQRGKPILLVTVSGWRSLDYSTRRVLVVAAQHGDEPAGTQAALILIHQFATRQDPALERVLDRVTFYFIPVANPDGAASCQRNTANGRNMNRDWSACQLPETQAIAEVIKRCQPDVLLDLHEQTPRDREGVYVQGSLVPLAAPLLKAVHAACRGKGLRVPILNGSKSPDRRLLHWHFAWRYRRPALMVESKYTGHPAAKLGKRSAVHLVTILAVAERLAAE